VTSSHIPDILIVDDTHENLQLLMEVLSRAGYSVRPVADGPTALMTAQAKPPDLILLDVTMPGMNGFEVCAELSKVESTKDIPVIFITARNDTEVIVKSFKAGGKDFISKPFREEELLARVGMRLEILEKRKLLLQKNRDLKRMNEKQNELLHVLCHDLQSHFGNVQSSLQIAKNFPENREEMMGLASSSSEYGLELIALFRQLIYLEEKEIMLSKVNLSECFNKSMSILKNRMKEKEILLETSIPREIHVLAEPVTLYNSVINNLLTNALKFSLRGSKILVQTSINKKSIQLKIRDFGIGIPSRLLKNIFNPVKKTHRSGTENELGTGFGMPLVKKYMETYGGQIQIQSWENSDSTSSGTEITLIFKQA